MLSQSTAQLVEGAAALGEPEFVQIRVSTSPSRPSRVKHRGTASPHRTSRVESGRSAVGDIRRRGPVGPCSRGPRRCNGVVGPPGIGKSRLVREVAAMAAPRGVEVFTAFCESHTSQVPFYAVARLLRAATGVEGLDARQPVSGYGQGFLTYSNWDVLPVR